MAAERLTPLETKIMNALWELGEGNVQAVQQRLAGDRELAYTTVQTMLNILLRKGQVKRSLRDRAYVYAPVVSREAAAGGALRQLIDSFFHGSAEGLVMSLVKQKQLGPRSLERIRAMIEASEKGNKR